MDLQSFIQSGLLESYVLGQATAEERSLVERMLIQHPEARTEMAAIERALESYAQAVATAPPSWMKGRILDQIAQQPLPNALQGSSAVLRTFQIAALALLLAGAFFWNQNRQLRTENTTQQTQLLDCTQRSEARESLFAMFKDTATQIIKIKSLNGVGGNAMVYSNPALHQVILNTKSISSANQQGVYFQCWAIVAGVPQDMGMVELNDVDGWQTLRYIEHAEKYAISAENNPKGNPSPTTVLMMSSDKING